jgi:hypothetical protein
MSRVATGAVTSAPAPNPPTAWAALLVLNVPRLRRAPVLGSFFREYSRGHAIGLSKARRAGVKLAAPRKGTASSKVRKQASRDYREGQSPSAFRKTVSRHKCRFEQGRTRCSFPQVAGQASAPSCAPARVSRASPLGNEGGPYQREQGAPPGSWKQGLTRVLQARLAGSDKTSFSAERATSGGLRLIDSERLSQR